MKVVSNTRFSNSVMNNAILETPGSLPAGLGTADAGRVVHYNGNVYVWTGSAWNTWTASSGMPAPSLVKFVSPGFTGYTNPYFTTIQAAINQAATDNNNSLIIVYPGIYSEKLNITKDMNIYLHSGVTIKPSVKNSADVIAIGTGVSYFRLDGDGVISSDDTIYNPYCISINTAATCDIRFGSCTGATANSIRVTAANAVVRAQFDVAFGKCEVTAAAMLDVRCRSMGLIRIAAVNAKVRIDTIAFERLLMLSGSLTMNFQESYGQPTGSAYIVDISGGTSVCECKLIGGLISGNRVSPDPLISIQATSGILTKLELQNVQVKNAGTGFCIYINFGLLITDGCTLISQGGDVYSPAGFGVWRNYHSVSNCTGMYGIAEGVDTLVRNTLVV